MDELVKYILNRLETLEQENKELKAELQIELDKNFYQNNAINNAKKFAKAFGLSVDISHYSTAYLEHEFSIEATQYDRQELDDFIEVLGLKYPTETDEKEGE